MIGNAGLPESPLPEQGPKREDVTAPEDALPLPAAGSIGEPCDKSADPTDSKSFVKWGSFEQLQQPVDEVQGGKENDIQIDCEMAGPTPFPHGGAEEETPPTPVARRGTSLREGLYISLNYNLGFCLLVFPFHFARMGWVGLVAFAGVTAVTWVTAMFIADIMLAHRDVHTYTDMGRKAAYLLTNGSKLADRFVVVLFRSFQMLELFTSMLFCKIAIEEAMLALWPDLSEQAAVVASAALVFAVTPVTLSPRLLARAGSLGIVLSLACLVLLVVSSGLKFTAVGAENLFEIPVTPHSIKAFLGGYGGTIVLLAGHSVYPSLFDDLEDKADMRRLVNYTYLAMVLCCIVIALLVVGSFGPSAIQDLPTGHLDPGTTVNIIGQALIIVKMTFSYGPITYPIINELAIITHGVSISSFSSPLRAWLSKHGTSAAPAPPCETKVASPPASRATRLFLGALVTFQGVMVALAIPSLAFALSLAGSVLCVSLSLTLPAAVFVVVMPRAPFRHLAKLIIVFGVLSSTFSLYAIL
mmetsp:Transcript_724/g.1939  ORF Transcript_724/g.1939 Transcript_724/m.1939 type:complete len:527 (-) Transcript_724:143-1723(-)